MPTPKHKGMRYHYVIGIDPGVVTGCAIRDTLNCRYEFIGSDTILRVMEIVKTRSTLFDVFVRVEDARKRKWFGKTQREVLQGAGSIKRDCQIWEEFLTTNKIPHEFVAPKNNKTKLDAKKFKQYTGYQGTTNGHSRDAGCLLLGY
jgi:hypothetical protein